MYLLDANVFMEASRFHYSFDIAAMVGKRRRAARQREHAIETSRLGGRSVCRPAK